MKILVTGGCGYKGHILIPKLLKKGFEVIVLDTIWFGNHLENHSKLSVIKADIRECQELNITGVDILIHLASIANDPCGELNAKLTWEVNALATMTLAEWAVAMGVKQFIYASSGSVYGICDAENITEELSLNPISDYNKTKMVSERILMSYSQKFNLQILRPATVCGISPRMRFDVAVNLLTIQALSSNEITVLGGNQIRPNVHIQDITDAYLHFIEKPNITGIFNIGFENLSIMDIAKIVTKVIPAKITVLESNDPRSYKVDSTKILDTGFIPKKTVVDSVLEIKQSFEKGLLENKPEFNNLQWMQKKIIAKEA